MNGVQAWGSVKAHIIIVCERFGNICVNRWGLVKCPSCGEDEAQDLNYSDVPAPVFKKATIPAPMIPHSFCSPELLAHILYEKYVMVVPLERQAKELKAMGMRSSTATLSNWVIYAAETFMKPVYAKMKQILPWKEVEA